MSELLSTRRPLPIVAIVGRPNVGKSTLFNRLAGGRRALVENRPGLTRDRIYEVVETACGPLLLVDTGGLEAAPRGELEREVRQQAQVAIDEADAILFLVDGCAGLLPDDRAVARALRRAQRPTALLVNKIDVPRHEGRIADFLGLGFPLTLGISAEHGRGAWDALETLAAQLPAPPAAKAAESSTSYGVAIAGRPNVGKSSLLNRLCGNPRAVVSAQAGTTRDAVTASVRRGDVLFQLVDTAGLRRRAHRDRLGERAGALATLRAVESSEVAVVVVDAGDGVTERDLRIIGAIRERGRGLAIALNKWDRIEGAASGEAVERAARQSLHFLPSTPVLRVSAKTGFGVKRILPTAQRLAEAGRLRVSTAELNRWLQQSVAAHEPAMAQRGTRKRPLRFFYATQTGTQPPSLLLFCSDPAAVRGEYRRYLENRFRDTFRLGETPVRLTFRARR